MAGFADPEHKRVGGLTQEEAAELVGRPHLRWVEDVAAGAVTRQPRRAEPGVWVWVEVRVGGGVALVATCGCGGGGGGGRGQELQPAAPGEPELVPVVALDKADPGARHPAPPLNTPLNTPLDAPLDAPLPIEPRRASPWQRPRMVCRRCR